MKKISLLILLSFFVSKENAQIAVASVNQDNKYRPEYSFVTQGIGYSFCFDTFTGETPVFFSAGGFIVNSSYGQLKGYCSEVMMKLGFGYFKKPDNKGIVVGLMGGGEFDDYSYLHNLNEGFGLGGWIHLSYNSLLSLNLENTYNFNTKSILYKGSLNIKYLSVNVIYLKSSSGNHGLYICPGLIIRFNTLR